MAVALTRQAAAVRITAVNFAGHVNNLRSLSERGKRSKIEYEMAAARLPDLRAAAETLERIASDPTFAALVEKFIVIEKFHET